jgi:hypothetical protein
VDESVTGFWQISVLRVKIASMTTSREVTGIGMIEDGLVDRPTLAALLPPRRRIIVRLHGSLSKGADTA